ncbi:MAG: hypothetical protein LAT68_05125 [Cyclobacteriaceae bacterium]|nr:hypothetical protein [Cyclobacteriaceae bacterium]MCH8515692.1 hypothetical protein [Cyclobacteriaceae bacterium]
MKNMPLIFSVFCITIALFFTQEGKAKESGLEGAWELIERDGEPVDYKMIRMYSKGYFTFAAFREDDEFIKAGGGTYQLKRRNYIENYEIHSENHRTTGQSYQYSLERNADVMTLTLKSSGDRVVEKWRKIDGAAHEMAQCYRIHKRVTEDNEWFTVEYAPRKTLKILTDSRYQILALNSKTGEFWGSSGGTWGRKDDRYTENIEFFSKRENEVGRSLSFDIKWTPKEWHHKGTATDGDDLEEIWLPYK